MCNSVIHILTIKANKIHYFSALFGKELYVFRTDLLSIIRSLDAVFTAISYCHTSYVDCLLERSGWNCSSILILLASCQQACMTYTIAVCTVKKTPDDGQRKCPKHVEFQSKNKFEKFVHLVDFTRGI